MAATYQFNPKDSQLVYAGKLVTGFASGSYITLSRNADMWTTTIGADGIGTRVKSNNFSGRLQITLQQTAESNNDLDAIIASDELNDDGALPLFFKHGNFIAEATTAWIVKRPDAEFSSDLTNRVYILESNDLRIVGQAA